MMKNKIRHIVSYLALFLCFFLGSCSPSNPSQIERWAQQNGKIKVLSTTAMIDDIVAQIGGERIDHIALITGEIDPHSYELVKGDDEKLLLAQVIFYNGLGLEHGASLRYQLEHHRNAIGVGNFILQNHPESILHVGKEIDPHVWMDISLWSLIIDPIVKALTLADPQGKEVYTKNAAILREKMLHRHQEIYQSMQKVSPKKRYLVTSHDAFNYFAQAYLAAPNEKTQAEWQKRVAAPEGLAPEGQLSVSDIQKIIDHLIEYQIQVVFPESNVSRDSLKKIVHACAQKGLTVKISKEVLYGDAMGTNGSDADSYLKMIAHDANVMIQAWDGNRV
jgi:manganese/zinc/iron transport system substrate-binding protein